MEYNIRKSSSMNMVDDVKKAYEVKNKNGEEEEAILKSSMTEKLKLKE